MSHEISPARPRTLRNTKVPDYLTAYRRLLDEDRPILVVVRDSPPDLPPFPGVDAVTPTDPLTIIRVWLNRPLLSMLGKNEGDRFLWSPIWWRDDSHPDGKVILWRDLPRGRLRGGRIRSRVFWTVSLSLFGPKRAQLWFPVPAITHYAIDQFSPRPHGYFFNPLDAFQRCPSIRC